MKLILTQEVTGLGAPGDIVEVKDGYGRNYLVPRGVAIRWTRGGEKQIDVDPAAREVRAVRDLGHAERGQGPARGPGRQTSRCVPAPAAGCSARSPSPTSSTPSPKAGGAAVDKRRIEVGQPDQDARRARGVGPLHPEVSATVALNVVPA